MRQNKEGKQMRKKMRGEERTINRQQHNYNKRWNTKQRKEETKK